ncbi:unnamed protein product [Prorocentrum cordatum]|uniref:RING-type domain-containing protein n=1 Tax=Prorocentrum cordatum TaxID=2364126 RepID=A0ABN9URC4_9DINO|nr:unnamed protein product [Polarella glacialis]
MQIPEDLRCCVCLGGMRDMLLTGCPHRLCAGCSRAGSLVACPVCQAALPPGRPRDEGFAASAEAMRLACGCGVQVPLLEAESHVCEHVRQQQAAAAPASTGPAPAAGPNRSTFTSDICGERNLSCRGLLEHVDARHAGRPVAAVCPVCLAMPWGDPNFVSQNFQSHLKLRHRCDYDTVVDFELDEDAMMMRAIEESRRASGLSEGARPTHGAMEMDDDVDDAVLQEVLRMSAREACEAPDAPPSHDEGSDGQGLDDAQAAEAPAAEPAAGEGERGGGRAGLVVRRRRRTRARCGLGPHGYYAACLARTVPLRRGPALRRGA